MRQRPLPKPLRAWMDGHGQRDFTTCAVAAYYLQCHYPDLLEGNYGVRAGAPRLKDTNLQTYFVYDLWRAEMGGDYTDPALAEDCLKLCAEGYPYGEDKCRAAIEFEAWLRDEQAPPWPTLKLPWPPPLPRLNLHDEDKNKRHREAMRLSHVADRLEKDGELGQAQEVRHDAFILERSVGLEIQKYPARSIVLASAVALAVECCAIGEAKVVGEAVLTDPCTPDFIKLQVQELLHRR